jgi:hypothetical protein
LCYQAWLDNDFCYDSFAYYLPLVSNGLLLGLLAQPANGLSTEQDFSPASGHLYTIKSNFNSVDEIRNLEYEYDLMDNVTQRQNDFCYDSFAY